MPICTPPPRKGTAEFSFVGTTGNDESNIIRYVNAPAAGFETTDTLTSVALVAKF